MENLFGFISSVILSKMMLYALIKNTQWNLSDTRSKIGCYNYYGKKFNVLSKSGDKVSCYF